MAAILRSLLCNYQFPAAEWCTTTEVSVSFKKGKREGTKGRRGEGTKERREQGNKGTKEQRNKGNVQAYCVGECTDA